MLKNIFLFFIKFYICFISPFMLSACRFYPTCSIYSCEIINKYGIFKGLIFIIKRIGKCHPWHKGGYDPIP